MDIDSTASLVKMLDATAMCFFRIRSMVQTLVDEAIALRKPLEKIFVVNIIHWDMKVVIAT